MNILTFDTEEWFFEKRLLGDRKERYPILDYYLKTILDLLDEQNLKATFFCVGGLAKDFPEIVKEIVDRGHEIGCHSNTHKWLTSFNRTGLMADTETAIKSLEDVTSKKVISYRAPAYTICEKNKWALEILAECGIERDASIYPSVRDFGGFDNFPSKEPCIINVGDKTIKEFPISLTTIAGKHIAYSGGGYFRFFPLMYIKKIMRQSDYNMTYFHIADLEYQKFKLQTKEFFESNYNEPGTLKNRVVRMMKISLGTKGSFDKMCNLVRSFDYINLEEADKVIDWNNVKKITL